MFLDINEIKSVNLKEGFLKQYIELKKDNFDSILLFQIGDFYETFFQDAKIFSDVTGSTLGSRNVKGLGEVVQAGIPISTLELYVKKLISENLKVCVCNQIKNEDGEIQREVVRKYTKGTIVENELLEAFENNYICAVFENNQKYSISYADVSTGQFYTSLASFEEMVFEIDKISPNEILICENQKEKFSQVFSKYNLTILKSNFFESKNSSDAILRYCIYTQKNFMPKLDDIIEYKINSFLIMDEITRRNLEIRRTRRYLKKKGSLFWFLNYTKTPMGSRLLKKYIDEPLLNEKILNSRLDAIDEIILNKDKIDDVDNLLEQFCDLSRICAKVSNCTILPKDLFLLVNNAKIIETLVQICNHFKSPLLKIDSLISSNVIDFLTYIKGAISENSSDVIFSGGIIKDGCNTNLDYLRAELKAAENRMTEYFEHEKKRFKIEKMKLNYSKTIGYYFEIPASKEKLLSGEYFKKQTLSNTIRFSSSKLQELEDKNLALKYKINELEYQIYCEIRKEAVDFVDKIREISKEIAKIDVLFSFAKCALLNALTRPKYIKNSIKIKNGFHPSLLESCEEIVKNDTELFDSSMVILTGANMSGKSTYLKHNAIISLLAQIGSFVPADMAELEILDRIFVRQGSVDDIINNSSSFMVEMNDLKFILDHATKASLILLDEPAKSTNASEGGAIARAFCEYMIKNYESKMMIATHNLELTKLEKMFPNKVFNYVIGAFDDAKKVGINRKVVRGTVNSSLAINTAKLAGLPSELVENAKKYL